MQKEIIIIGGGLAGLSTAIHAIKKGFRPIIFEKSRHLGGRTRSFYSSDIQETIDNGQHVILSVYHETIKLLKWIGSIKKLKIQTNFSTLFIKDPQNKFVFRTVPLPAPFHFFLSLMFKKNFMNIKLSSLFHFVQKNFLKVNNQLKDLTVSEWLNQCKQGEKIQKFLWEPLTVSILNTPPHTASAQLLRKAVIMSFLNSRKDARLALPKAWLSEIFANPMEKFILENGGSIHRLTPVLKFIESDDQIISIVTRKEQIQSPWIISTLPPYALAQVLKKSKIKQLEPLLKQLLEFYYHPIITINLFLSKPIELPFPISPVNSEIHWIFQHPYQEKSSKYFGYALVISAADKWAWQSSESILQMVKFEMRRLLGISLDGEYSIRKYKIVKEKHATIAQTPTSLGFRAQNTTPIKNFFLAGDWTDTGLPATIEGAILSGKLAIEALSRSQL